MRTMIIPFLLIALSGQLDVVLDVVLLKETHVDEEALKMDQLLYTT